MAYHGFHDMFAYIMEPARRDDAGWGRQLPGAPPSPASPSPTCWAVENLLFVGSEKVELVYETI
jgi:hypothetical protein